MPVAALTVPAWCMAVMTNWPHQVILAFISVAVTRVRTLRASPDAPQTFRDSLQYSILLLTTLTRYMHTPSTFQRFLRATDHP